MGATVDGTPKGPTVCTQSATAIEAHVLRLPGSLLLKLLAARYEETCKLQSIPAGEALRIGDGLVFQDHGCALPGVCSASPHRCVPK